MPHYAYNAYSKDGSSVSGDVQAESEIAALDLIAQRGLTPITLTKGGQSGPWWSRDINLFGTGGKPKSGELERFFTSFAALLQARFPLPKTLRYCETQTRDRAMKRALESIRTSVESGETLGQAMRGAGGVFPERFISLIVTGETSNRLAEISGSAARLLNAEAKLKRDLRSALIYPVILLVMSALVLALVVFYLAPTLMPVFVTAGAEPPVILQFMAGVRVTVLSGWPFLLLSLIALALMTLAFHRKLTTAFSALLMRLPLTGHYLKRRETLKLCQSLHLMLASGAPLTQALSAAQDATTFPAYKALLAKAQEHVIAGGTLSETLAASPLIDDMARALIEAGEESDRLGEVLETVVTSLSASTAQMLNQMIGLLTPLLTLIIGVGVGAVILSTISAIMDLNDIAF